MVSQKNGQATCLKIGYEDAKKLQIEKVVY